MYHIFIYLSLDNTGGLFLILIIMNNAAVDICIQVFVRTCIFNFLEYT